MMKHKDWDSAGWDSVPQCEGPTGIRHKENPELGEQRLNTHTRENPLNQQK
jgi:hypothetical protein